MESEGIRSVVLRRSEASGMGLGLGFSIMGGAGYDFPPVIYGIEKDSPAARSGSLEAGDIILAINEREVVKLSTKEVLKCLRLSGDIVNIKYKRDPEVVSRVRHFLSAPNFLEENTGDLSKLSPRKGNSIPKPRSNTPNSGVPYHLGEYDLQPAHITFSDDLFINHSQNVSSQPVTQSENKKVFFPHPFEPNNKNGRKNFETFVMTGEAMLNLTRNDSNESYRSSPGKTCSSKLTPMPPGVIYSMVDKGRKEEKESKEEETPPLPPPPPLSGNNSSSKSESKSDILPPPPPPLSEEEKAKEKDQWNNPTLNGLVNGNGRAKESPNEDTSISSSVMSDSGEEGEELPLDDVNKIVLKVEANASQPVESYECDSKHNSNKESPIKIPERERYNEYILLNGSSGTNEDEERSRSSGKANWSSQSSRKRETLSEEEKPEGSEEEAEDSSEVAVASSFVASSGGGESGGSFSGDSDSSDVESMRVAPVVKAVDVPSAERLAKRLFALDGFKVADVWRHLSKLNEFSRCVATEYLKFFDFRDQQLDVSLRKFLAVCPLRGETQERERVLSHFSSRYVECNPGIFASQDSVHTLTCALMLLNTDMYSGVRSGRRPMSLSEFIDNLRGLNDGEDFPKNILKQLYNSIKYCALVSPDIEEDDSNREMLSTELPSATSSIETKRGYLIRKSIYEMGGKKTPLGKRSWKMVYCRLKDLQLGISADESNKIVGIVQSIRIHHALAVVANEYVKRPHVFRLLLADKSQYLFQTSDTREMHSWIDMINWNCSRYSSPALEAPCGSSRRFERPTLPSSLTRLSARDQLITHQAAQARAEEEIEILSQNGGKKSKGIKKGDLKEMIAFYQFEIRRYKIYVEVLERRGTENEIGAGDQVELQTLPNPPAVLSEIEESL